MSARSQDCQRTDNCRHGLIYAPHRALLIVDDNSIRVQAQRQQEQRRPLYSQRQSPLIQSHGASAFIERTWDRFGIQDLAHEWVTVFQSMVDTDAGHLGARYHQHQHQQSHSSRRHQGSTLDGMKLLIPDTVLLNPSGQPSLWFATSSSGRVKTKQLVHATPREIMRAFMTSRSSSPWPNETDIVAVQRIGFQTRMLTSAELKAVCWEMESTRGILQLPQFSSRTNGNPKNDASEDAADDTDNADEQTGSRLSPGKTTQSRPALRSFCLQQFVPRYGGVRFFAIWRQQQQHRRNQQPPPAASDRKNAVSNLRTASSRSAREAGPQPPSLPRLHHIPHAMGASGKRNSAFVCDLFLQRYRIATPIGSTSASTGGHPDSARTSDDKEPRQLRDEEGDEDTDATNEEHQTLEKSDDAYCQCWMDQVERGEKLVPLRINADRRSQRQHSRGRDNVGEHDGNDGSDGEYNDESDEEQRELVRVKRILQRLALDPNVVIPQLFHIKRVTVELLSRVNEVAGKHASPRHAVGLACEFFLDAKDQQAHLAGVTGIQWEGCSPTWEMLRFQDATSAKLSAYYAFATSGEYNNDEDEDDIDDSKAISKKQQHALALRLFDELNPRFPSVQSPLVDAAQWKFRSVLLPPDVAPRFVGAEVPKKFRRGRFRPLLCPEQAVSVSRLHLSPRAPSPLASAVRHPLSRRFASDEAVPEPMTKSPKKAPGPRRSDDVAVVSGTESW